MELVVTFELVVLDILELVVLLVVDTAEDLCEGSELVTEGGRGGGGGGGFECFEGADRAGALTKNCSLAERGTVTRPNFMDPAI